MGLTPRPSSSSAVLAVLALRVVDALVPGIGEGVTTWLRVVFAGRQEYDHKNE